MAWEIAGTRGRSWGAADAEAGARVSSSGVQASAKRSPVSLRGAASEAADAEAGGAQQWAASDME